MLQFKFQIHVLEKPVASSPKEVWMPYFLGDSRASALAYLEKLLEVKKAPIIFKYEEYKA